MATGKKRGWQKGRARGSGKYVNGATPVTSNGSRRAQAKLVSSLRSQLHANKISASRAGKAGSLVYKGSKRPAPKQDRFGGTIVGQSGNKHQKMVGYGTATRYNTTKRSTQTSADVKMGRIRLKRGDSGGRLQITHAKATGNRQRKGMKSLGRVR